jgi:hypothetical protein
MLCLPQRKGKIYGEFINSLFSYDLINFEKVCCNFIMAGIDKKIMTNIVDNLRLYD